MGEAGLSGEPPWGEGHLSWLGLQGRGEAQLVHSQHGASKRGPSAPSGPLSLGTQQEGQDALGSPSAPPPNPPGGAASLTPTY